MRFRLPVGDGQCSSISEECSAEGDQTMYKRITDSWILCQETSSSVVEVYLLRDSLSCCSKRDPKHNGLVKTKSYSFLT